MNNGKFVEYEIHKTLRSLNVDTLYITGQLLDNIMDAKEVG